MYEITKFNRTIDETKFEGKASSTNYYAEALLCIRRIYRLFNVLFQTDSHNFIRANLEVEQALNRLLNIYDNLYLNLTQNMKKELQLSRIIYKDLSINDSVHLYELIFIQKLINHLIDETNNLTKILITAKHCAKTQ